MAVKTGREISIKQRRSWSWSSAVNSTSSENHLAQPSRAERRNPGGDLMIYGSGRQGPREALGKQICCVTRQGTGRQRVRLSGANVR
jgi:hypothetical protein